ncbi:hypothetical protein A0H81_10312 [Grifola frondosa]|uniref:Uncharacterized protein n=1 Tax=Grifola frondosa TaxID=5627 RepID=A0A1C7LYW2_GRIFR|nr:hypothetical protein A0H81_10312 [Grifola frondosa]
MRIPGPKKLKSRCNLLWESRSSFNRKPTWVLNLILGFNTVKLEICSVHYVCSVSSLPFRSESNALRLVDNGNSTRSVITETTITLQ